MVELKSSLRRRIEDKLKSLVTEGAAPGFSLALGLRDQTLGIFSAGFSDPRKGIPCNASTWFDLASLTKVISTTSLCMRAVQRHELVLDCPLQSYFPQWKSELRHRVIRDLLNHTAGLPPTFEKTADFPTRDEKIRYFIQEVDSNYPSELPRGKPVYSDVDFMILGILLEQVFGKRLRKMFDSSNDLSYGPIHFRGGFLRSAIAKIGRLSAGVRIVAPILSTQNSKRWLDGEVQDPRAEWLDGDAGHAGLFGTARGVEEWAKNLYSAYYGKSTVLSDKVVRAFIDFENAPSTDVSSFLLGFDRPSGTSQAGKLFSRHSTVGHLGYTGTSFWMDFEKGIRVTLLSHRFAPNFDPEKLRKLRPGFHDWLIAEVFSKLLGLYD